MFEKQDSYKLNMSELVVKPYIRPNKVERVFENDDWVVDVLETDKGPVLRVSVFDDRHFLDDTYIRKNDYLEG